MVEIVKENYIRYDDGEEYAIEKRFMKKMIGISKRLNSKKPKLDQMLINEGKPGRGKTNTSILELFILKALTKRDKLYLVFDLVNLMKIASRESDLLIDWDEPGLDSMSADQVNNLNKDMRRFFIMGRMMGHFYAINYTKFYKFPEDISVDRADGMICMNNNVKRLGKWHYIPPSKMEKLYNDYKKRHERNYHKYTKYRGNFPEIMEKHFSELGINVVGVDGKEYHNASYEIYNREKHKAIMEIGKKKENKASLKWKEKLGDLRYKISNLPMEKETLAAALGVSSSRLREWKKYKSSAP